MKQLSYIFPSIIFLFFSIIPEAKGNDTAPPITPIDSLKQALKEAAHDTTRCKLLNELVETEYDVKIWPVYNEQLKIIAEKNATQSVDKRIKFIYLKYLAGALNNTGFLAVEQGDISKAIEYYDRALKIQKEISDQNGIATSFNNMGFIYNQYGDISKALEYYHKALELQEKTQDKKGTARSLNNIGLIYDNQGDNTKALEYYYKSLKTREEINDKDGIATSLNNISGVFSEQKHYSKSIELLNKSLKIYEEINDKFGIITSMNNIGNLYRGQGLHNDALNYYLRSLKISEAIDNKEGKAYTLQYIATAFDNLGKLNEALTYAKRSMVIAEDLGYPENIRNTSLLLKDIYQKQGNYQEAFKMYGIYIQMRDSINNEETQKASVRRQFQYQYEKKASADSVKNMEAQKVKNAQLAAQQAQLKQERTQRFALYGGLLLVIAFSGFVYNRFKITQKQKVIIEQQKNEVDLAYGQLHEKNKEITDSIIYARRIQQALITPEKYIDKQIKRLTKNKTS